MNNKRAREHKNPDLRAPQEKAEWEEIRAGSLEMQRRARLPEAPKPFDLWSYDTAQLLDELAGIREIILRVPITMQTKSALQVELRLERRLRVFSTEAATKAEPDRDFNPSLRRVYNINLHLSSGYLNIV